jgi:hypothetical protein
MVDNVLSLYYSKIMVSEDIKHEVKKLHIGKKIRDLRKKAGLVLQDLSNETGLSSHRHPAENFEGFKRQSQFFLSR